MSISRVITIYKYRLKNAEVQKDQVPYYKMFCMKSLLNESRETIANRSSDNLVLTSLSDGLRKYWIQISSLQSVSSGIHSNWHTSPLQEKDWMSLRDSSTCSLPSFWSHWWLNWSTPWPGVRHCIVFTLWHHKQVHIFSSVTPLHSRNNLQKMYACDMMFSLQGVGGNMTAVRWIRLSTKFLKSVFRMLMWFDR